MNRITSTILKCLLLPLLAFTPAKNASVKWGPEIDGKKTTITGTLGIDDSGYYVYGLKRTGLLGADRTISKLNKSLNVVSVYEFEEKDKATKRTFVYEGSCYFNEKILVFKSTTVKGDKLRELYVEEINKSSMTASGKLKKIAEYPYEKSFRRGSFNVKATDRKVEAKDGKIVVTFQIPGAKKETEKIKAIVLDNELNPMWKKEIELPYEEGLYFTGSFRVDKYGNIYSLGKLYNEKVKSVIRGKQNYVFHLISYTNNGENMIDTEIKLKDLFITDITYRVEDNGDIVTGGFYSKRKQMNSVDGAFYMVTDSKTKDVKATSVKEFDIDFITQGMTEKQEEKAKKREEKGKDQELYEYDLDNLIMRDDGGAVLVGEQYYVVVSTYTDAKGNRTTTYTYYYNNIIIINIDNAGKIEWAQTIPKRQVSSNDQGAYSSYALMVKDDKLHFIFNDNRQNLNPKKQGGYKNYSFRDKDGIVAIATVDRDGKITREALIDAADIEVGVKPKVCDQINDNQMLIFGERKKKDQFAIVDFSDK